MRTGVIVRMVVGLLLLTDSNYETGAGGWPSRRRGLASTTVGIDLDVFPLRRIMFIHLEANCC